MSTWYARSFADLSHKEKKLSHFLRSRPFLFSYGFVKNTNTFSFYLLPKCAAQPSS